ncbi:MAG: c-type cytochrome [Actinomycetota bacterium]
MISYRNILALILIFAVAALMSSPVVAQTADLYKTKCAACHGPDGKGDTAIGKKMGVKSFTDPEVAKNSDQTWFEITKNGKGKMPGYNGKLTDDQIKDLVKHIRALK